MTASSDGSCFMSPRCHGNIMWMIELAMKTKTAETRIGMQSEITGTMTGSSCEWVPPPHSPDGTGILAPVAAIC